MGKVTNYLESLIMSRIKDKGIIVWYDPEHTYEAYLQKLDFGNIPLYRYEGSYFKLRKEIDGYLSGNEFGKCLIYVPCERKKGASPLIEAEAAGQAMEPGAVSGANTRLEVIARGALSDILTADNVDEICKGVAQGSLNLEDLDKIAEKGKEVGKGAIVLIFGTTDSQDVALRFASSDEFDSLLVEKMGIEELVMLFNVAYGLETTATKPEEIRKDFIRYVLLTEFLSYVVDKGIHGTFEHAPKAAKQAHIDPCRMLASTWRNRIDLKKSYERLSIDIEEVFSICDLKIDPKEIASCDTFTCIDKWICEHACELIISNNFTAAIKLIENRKTSFWIMADPTGLIRWNLLDTAACLIEKAQEIMNELKSKPFDHSALIDRYIEGTADASGWYKLDYFHRLLEKQYANYDEGISGDNGTFISKLIATARAEYSEAIGDMTTVFIDESSKNKYDFKNLPLQKDIFKTYITENVKIHKTAYILVDALRYEMGKELFDSLSEFKDRQIKYAIAGIPTITPIGMVSLLPEAEKGITIAQSGDGSIQVQINDYIFKNRQNRIDWIKNSVDEDVVDLKLEQLTKPGKKVKEKINDSQLVIVTSQEIDEIGEGDNVQLARKIMNDVLDELVRAFRNLYHLGIEYFVITADHGYLFGEELADSMKIDPPGGKTIALHRRFWAGYGGKDEESYVRIPSSRLGVNSDLEFAFPKGLGGFKVKGGGRAYFHGGLSLEELLIPVITVNAGEIEKTIQKQNVYKIAVDRSKITSRFFTVKVEYGWTGFFGDEKHRVRIAVKAGNKEVGKVATAVYGHETGTSEVILEKDKENFVTLMVDEGIKEKDIVVSILDQETGKELAKSEQLEIVLTF